jgi:hypothetical protein
MSLLKSWKLNKLIILKMLSEYHCQRTKEILGLEDSYEEIHKYLDRGFDWAGYERLCSLTDGDWLS